MTPKQKAFLAAYAVCGSVSGACLAADVGRRTHYDWLADPDYKAAFDEAEEIAIEAMELEARRRAIEGAMEPVIYQGRVCFDVARDSQTGEVLVNDDGEPLIGDKPLVVPRKSDNLLMFLLKSKRPERYRDNATVEHTGAGGGPMTLTVEFVKPKAA